MHKADYVTEADYDFKANYEVFWNLVNENYCFLGDNYGYTKKVGGERLDWNKVYEEMMPLVEAAKTEEELLDIMGKSIDYLQDGHVWIDSKFNHRGCFTFYNIAYPNEERYPTNFNLTSFAKRYWITHTRQETVIFTVPSPEVTKSSSICIMLNLPGILHRKICQRKNPCRISGSQVRKRTQ